MSPLNEANKLNSELKQESESFKYYHEKQKRRLAYYIGITGFSLITLIILLGVYMNG